MTSEQLDSFVGTMTSTGPMSGNGSAETAATSAAGGPSNQMDIEDEFRGLVARFTALKLARRSGHVPPVGYLCDLCFEPGHFIKNCRQYVTRDEGLTPYQGIKRCYGEFRCSRCKRRWSSCRSYSNEGQDCRKCKIPVYPHKQWPLVREFRLFE